MTVETEFNWFLKNGSKVSVWAAGKVLRDGAFPTVDSIEDLKMSVCTGDEAALDETLRELYMESYTINQSAVAHLVQRAREMKRESQAS